MRVGNETITVQRYGGVWVQPAPLRQVFNDTEQKTLWLIVGAPEAEFLPGEDHSLWSPTEPRALPTELAGSV